MFGVHLLTHLTTFEVLKGMTNKLHDNDWSFHYVDHTKNINLVIFIEIVLSLRGIKIFNGLFRIELILNRKSWIVNKTPLRWSFTTLFAFTSVILRQFISSTSHCLLRLLAHRNSQINFETHPICMVPPFLKQMRGSNLA